MTSRYSAIELKSDQPQRAGANRDAFAIENLEDVQMDTNQDLG
jgi:hypothetical protein